ncbi:HNH endonuclease [Enterobacter hormaechei]|nr:HNH endonuclease [Enterobacter hormaechei]MCM7734685.1 HNH endonuclease [Enterobacter hormaechei]
MLSNCIEHKQKQLYGQTSTTVNGKTVSIKLHRKAYCEDRGVSLESIKGMVILHKCDNPRCINPKHLELGTQLDNVRDMELKGRANHVAGEKNGAAKLTPKDVLAIRSSLLKKNGAAKLTPKDVLAIRSSLLSNRKIAAVYGLSPSYISSIRLRKKWKHL